VERDDEHERRVGAKCCDHPAHRRDGANAQGADAADEQHNEATDARRRPREENPSLRIDEQHLRRRDPSPPPP